MQQNIVLPEIADNITSGLVGAILVSDGDTVTKDQALVEVETEKATMAIPASGAGVVAKILVSAGDVIEVGSTLMILEISADSTDKHTPEKALDVPATVHTEVPTNTSVVPRQSSPSLPKPQKTTHHILVAAAPSVRKLAREIGVPIEQVKGTGPGERITAADVKTYAKVAISTSTPAHKIPHVVLPDFSKWGEVEAVPFNRVRDITAQSMTTSWQTIPQVTQFDHADITSLARFRKQHASTVDKAGGKLTITSILVKIVALALQKFPNFNASIDMLNKQTILKSYYNIGIAVDTENGLLVPVIKQADQKSVTNISVEMSDLTQKAHGKTISPNDMSGGNFTISNLGGIGGTAFTPIVYAPQVAILGVSRASIQPIYIDGDWQPRQIMPLSLSYDHRLIDGADSARFLRWICQALENPMQVFL